MPRVRLDSLLTERGHFASRSRAAAAVIAGDVMLLPGRRRAAKPGQLVADDVELELAEAMPYVSRGGIKLANALDVLGVAVAGRSVLDVGASTGGFTDCVLQRGAARVTCVDVAYGELAYRLRSDDRVTVLERTNARTLTRDALPWTPDLVVADVSFISLEKILPAVLGSLGDRWEALLMVKPQFEVGRDRVGKGGVVTDPALRRSALVAVAASARGLGATVLGFASSGLPGPKGNRETFVWLADPDRGGGVQDLDAAATASEPA